MVWHKFFFYQVLRTAHEIQFRVTFRVPVCNSLSMPYNFNVYHSTRIICISANLHKTFTNHDFSWQITRLHSWTQTTDHLVYTQIIDYTDDRGTSCLSTDVSAVACVRAIPVTSEEYRQSAVPAVKIWNVFISSTKRKTKSNHKGRLINLKWMWNVAKRIY